MRLKNRFSGYKKFRDLKEQKFIIRVIKFLSFFVLFFLIARAVFPSGKSKCAFRVQIIDLIKVATINILAHIFSHKSGTF